MSLFEPLFPLSFFEVLGWTLMHFIWQGVLAALVWRFFSAC